jgi:hypothetical protein
MNTCLSSPIRAARFVTSFHHESDYIEQLFDIPDSSSPLEEPDDPSDLDDFDFGQDDDERWDVFIPDDDEFDPQPELGDFWNDEFPNDE